MTDAVATVRRDAVATVRTDAVASARTDAVVSARTNAVAFFSTNAIAVVQLAFQISHARKDNFDAIAIIQHELHKHIQLIGFLRISIQTLWITNLIFQKEE